MRTSTIIALGGAATGLVACSSQQAPTSNSDVNVQVREDVSTPQGCCCEQTCDDEQGRFCCFLICGGDNPPNEGGLCTGS